MNEWLIILTISVSGILFSAGGTHIDKIGGQKWLRRYLLPCFLAIMAFLSGVNVWWQLCILLALIVPLSAGYGSNSPYWKKVLVFTAYGLPTLAIGFSWWVVIMPVTLTLLFMASNWKPLANTVYWKAWEYLAGTLIGITLVGAILNRC